MAVKKFMQKVAKRSAAKGSEGALRKHYGVAEGQKIPTARLLSDARRLSRLAGKGTLTAAQSLLSKRVNMALRYRGHAGIGKK